jgi:hypothetical protein
VIACILAVLGIVVSGVIFVPLAALCAVTALIRALTGKNLAGVGVSALAFVLAAIGFAVAPSLWLLLFAVSVASSSGSSNGESKVENQRSALARNLDDVERKAQAFNREASNQIAMLAQAEDQCTSITTAMRSGLERESQVTRNPETALERTRITIEIEQGQFAMDRCVIQQSIVGYLAGQP